MNETHCTHVTTSLGKVRVFWTLKGRRSFVVRVSLAGEDPEKGNLILRTVSDEVGGFSDEMDRFCLMIRDFLNGYMSEFPLEGLDMSGCSPFQRNVLIQTRRIPRGRVMSYGRLAAIIGIPKGARAVGTALSKNPFPLIIPCHRVVQATGELGGFGGGLPLKKSLLEMEGVIFSLTGKVSQESFFT